MLTQRDYKDKYYSLLDVGSSAYIHSLNVMPFSKEWLQAKLDAFIYHRACKIIGHFAFDKNYKHKNRKVTKITK